MQEKLKVSLLTYTPNPEKVVSAAAKLCYSNSGIENILEGLTDEKVESFLNMLLSIGHASPLEHISFTFGIEGVSRSLTHQLVRHRIASYSQKSQRYVKEGQFGYIIPKEIEKDDEAKALYIKAMEESQRAYDELTRKLYEKHYQAYLEKYDGDEKKAHKAAEKSAIEDARYVLPNGCETKIVATMNARELLNFFKNRCCNRAQWEIRDLATEMLKLVRGVAPIIFKKAGPSCAFGPCPEGSMTCGQIEEVRKKFKSL